MALALLAAGACGEPVPAVVAPRPPVIRDPAASLVTSCRSVPAAP